MGVSSGDQDILRSLTDNEVKELYELYRLNLGDKDFHTLSIYSQLQWNEKLSRINVRNDDPKWISFRKQFYTHRDCDFRQYGTYVSLNVDLMQSVAFHSWQPDLRELFECLHQTQLIEWHNGALLTNVDSNHCEKIKKLALAKGAINYEARECCGFILEHEKALQLDVPSLHSDYIMRPLEPAHADLIHDLWPNNKEGSMQFIRGLIEINKTLGIFRKNNDELLAWVFENDFAGLGILQVQSGAQRQGFGSVLAAALSREIAKSGKMHLSAWTRMENFKSRALLTKLGYEKVIVKEWIQLIKSS